MSRLKNWRWSSFRSPYARPRCSSDPSATGSCRVRMSSGASGETTATSSWAGSSECSSWKPRSCSAARNRRPACRPDRASARRPGPARGGVRAEELRGEGDRAVHERDVQRQVVTVQPPRPRLGAVRIAEHPEEVPVADDRPLPLPRRRQFRKSANDDLRVQDRPDVVRAPGTAPDRDQPLDELLLRRRQLRQRESGHRTRQIRPLLVVRSVERSPDLLELCGREARQQFEDRVPCLRYNHADRSRSVGSYCVHCSNGRSSLYRKSGCRSRTRVSAFAGLRSVSEKRTDQWNQRMQNSRIVSPWDTSSTFCGASGCSKSRCMVSRNVDTRSYTSAPDSPWVNR